MGLDMSNTPELERLYCALGDFTYKALQQYQKDKTKMISLEVVEAIRHCTMDYLKIALETIGQKITEEGDV